MCHVLSENEQAGILKCLQAILHEHLIKLVSQLKRVCSGPFFFVF